MALCQKLREGGCYTWNQAAAYSEDLTKNLPKELYQNVYEWINGNSISDIKYEGVSIKDIMYQHKPVVHPFLMSLDVMLLYIKGGCKDKSICRKYFMWG